MSSRLALLMAQERAAEAEARCVARESHIRELQDTLQSERSSHERAMTTAETSTARVRSLELAVKALPSPSP